MRRAVLAFSVLVCAVAGCSSAAVSSHPSQVPRAAATTRAEFVFPSREPPTATATAPSSSSGDRHRATRHSSAAPVRTPTTSSSRVPAPRTATSAPAPAPSSRAVRRRPLVVLDPGHNGGNGSDPAYLSRQVYAGYGRYKDCNTTGTETNAGYPEHAFAWDVATRVRALLEQHGLRVWMTRPNDSGVGPCVNERAKIESTPGTVAAVAIHADGAPPAGHGFHVCYDSRTPEGASAATVAKSLRLSRTVHHALARSSGLVPSTYIGRNGYFPRDDLAGLNLSTSPTTFLELGNMRNASDAALLSSAPGRARIARAVVSGILAFLRR